VRPERWWQRELAALVAVLLLAAVLVSLHRPPERRLSGRRGAAACFSRVDSFATQQVVTCDNSNENVIATPTRVRMLRMRGPP